MFELQKGKGTDIIIPYLQFECKKGCNFLRNVLSLNPNGPGVMINNRPTTSSATYNLEVNGTTFSNTINSNNEKVYGQFTVSATGGFNHRIMSDPNEDSKQLLVGSKINQNLYLSLGIATG